MNSNLNGRLGAIVYHTTISASGSKKVTVILPFKPLQCVEIEVSTDQDVSWYGDFLDIAKAIENTDDGSYSSEFNTARIQGDLQLKAPTSDSFFELQSDPTINLLNNSSSTVKVLVKIIFRRNR